MRDSVDARLIPPDTDVVIGIVGGRFTWVPSWWDGSDGFDLFPRAVKLVIVPFASLAGDILDVETGDAIPADAPGWCRTFRRIDRRRPTLYCSRETWPAVVAALRAAGFGAVPDVDWWIATLDGTVDVAVPDGGRPPVAVQVNDAGPYDDSVVLDPTWPGGNNMTQEEHDALMQVRDILVTGGASMGMPPPWIVAELKDTNERGVAGVKAELDVLKAEVEAGGSVDAASAIARIEKALQGA